MKLRSRATAIDCAANASLASIKSRSSTFMPVLLKSLLVAATGPIPMIDGSTPPSAPATHVAIGVIPSSFAFSSLITTTAAAPSLIEEALPAVTRPPSGLNAGRSFASDSFVVPARGPSSVSTMIVSFFFLTSIGTISSLNLPASRAAQAFCWLLAANSSSSSLVMPHLSQMFSAVIPM